MDNEDMALAPAISRELALCNEQSRRFGLSLSPEQALQLTVKRAEALRDLGRVELGGGVLPLLVQAFGSSPYLWQEHYADTLAQLQELFYSLKNESGDLLSDGELAAFLRRLYDGPAQGSMEWLADGAWDAIRSYLRDGQAPEEGWEERLW